MTLKRIFLTVALAGLPTGAGAASLPPPGVAACSNCHPKNDSAATLRPLAGRNANAIIGAMDAFRVATGPATVMDRIAKGFTDDEIGAIAAWYAARR